MEFPLTGPGIFSYSTTPASNVNANTGINWDEGMAPAAVNNSARQNMTDLRNAFNDLIWFRYGKGDLDYSPVYASATTFTIAGVDVTAVYHAGRRIKAVGSGTGTIYGTISSVAFSTNTTVTVVWDSGSLSNETLTIYIDQVPVTGSPIPGRAVKPDVGTIIAKVSGEDTYTYSRVQKTTSIAQSTTTDILRLLAPDGSTVLGNTFVIGWIHICVTDEATGNNTTSYSLWIGTTGNGATNSNFDSVLLTNGGLSSGLVRGTALVASFGLVADGVGGAVKVQMTTSASGKTVTARASFSGMIK